MAYTPELDYDHSCTLRRIAWALEVPMTTAMGMIFDHLGRMLDRSKVCSKCRDNTRCKECAFNKS